jgi:hypothetical protein
MSGSLLVIWFVITASIFPYTLPAQISQPYRFEHEQKNFDDYFTIIPMKEKGLVLYREMDKYKQNNKLWQVIFLDTMLQERHKVELEIRDRYKLMGYETSPDRLYFLFRTGETTKDELLMIELSHEGEELKRFTVDPDLDFRLTHFIKTGENFIFGGYVSNEAVIILFERSTESIRVIPGFFQKDTELVDLRTNQNETFNTVLIGRGSRGDRKMIFRTFDSSGKQLLEDLIPFDEDITLQTGITSSLEREDLLIAGTWGDRNAKQSQGFYSVTVNPFEEQKINYVDFGRLHHFVDYLNEKRAARIKENSTESRENGKKPSFSAYVMPFRIAESTAGYYMLAEIYTQTGSTAMNYANPYYYNPVGYGMYPYIPGGYYYPGMSRMYRPYMYGPNSKSTEDVKTLATLVISFDPTGGVRWDQSLKLDEIRLPGLEQVGDFTIHDNKLFLVYKKESELKVKSIVLNEDESASEITEPVKTSDELDIIRSEKEQEGGVRQWFGNSFYVWGYQTIRNVKKEDRVRDVFYINRVDTF